MARPRVLVIRGGAIGDFILTLPAIRLLRENIAGCHLEVLGYPGIADLAITAGVADATRSLGHRDMAPLFAPGAAVQEEIAAYLASFNLVVSYLFDPDGIFGDNLRRLGVKTLVQCSHRVLPGGGPAAAQLARPLESLAFFMDDPAPCFPVLTSVAETSVANFILHPGSGSPSKSWPLENWLAALQQHQQNQSLTELRVILVTGEAEEAPGLNSQLDSLSRHGLFFERWHQTPLTELVPRFQSLAAASARFLGHDSGISHLAAACGLPCLLLFGPTDPATWAPQNAAVSILTAPGSKLDNLTVEEVTTALRQGAN